MIWVTCTVKGSIRRTGDYFHLRDDEKITDVDGTELIDLAAARIHADGVAQELMFKSTSIRGEEWSKWTMVVHDDDGLELFSFLMSDAKNDNGS
jgi:hypothetical protein